MSEPAADYGPTGPAALARHPRLVKIGGQYKPSGPGYTIATRVDECRIDALNSRGQLSDRQWRAGCLFRIIWTTANGTPGTTGRYGAVTGGSSGLEGAEAMQDAKGRLRASYGVLTLAQEQAVIAIAAMDEVLMGRHERLKDGLSALAELYRVPGEFCRWPLRD